MAEDFNWDQFEEAKPDEVEAFDFDQFEEISPEKVAQEKDITQGEAFKKGLLQGATFGFGEEIGAGVQAGAEATQRLLNKLGLTDKSPGQIAEELREAGFTGDIGPETVGETYRETRDIAREEERTAQEAYPKTYLAGELSSAVIPGAGVIGAAGKLGKGAGLAQRIGAGAKAGAKAGAAAGAGLSEADLTQGEIAQAAQDIATGAGAGVVGGSALPALGSLGRKAIVEPTQKVSDAITRTGKEATGGLGDIIRSYQLGRKGIDITGKKGSEFATGKVRRTAKTVQDRIFNQMDDLTDEKMTLAQQHSDKTAKIPEIREKVQQMLDDYAESFKTSGEAKRAEELLSQRIPDKNISLTEGIELSRRLHKLANRNSGPVRDLYRRAAGMISDSVEKEVPEMEPINRQISSGYNVLDDLSVKVGDRGDEVKKVAKFVEKYPQLFNSEHEITKESIEKGLKELFESRPEEVAALSRRLQAAGRDFGVGRRAESGPRLGAFQQVTGMSISDMASRLSNMMGRADRAIRLPGKEAKKLGQSLYDYSEDQLNKLADRIGVSDSKFANRAASRLREASMAKDQRRKNVLLFSLLQNPEMRKLFEDKEEE